MQAFFSTKSAMSAIVTSLALASVISSATSCHFCHRLNGSLATTFFRLSGFSTTFFRLSGFSILLRYPISFNVFLQVVKRAEKDCNAAPSSAFIAGPLVQDRKINCSRRLSKFLYPILDNSFRITGKKHGDVVVFK